METWFAQVAFTHVQDYRWGTLQLSDGKMERCVHLFKMIPSGIETNTLSTYFFITFTHTGAVRKISPLFLSA